MKKVAETTRLSKRGDCWHHYRRVPTAPVPIVGKTFIKKSLGTFDVKEARVLRNVLNVKVDAEFAALEAQFETQDAAQPLSMAALTEHLRLHIVALDNRSAARIAADPPDSED